MINGVRPFKLNPPEPAECCTKCRFSLVDGPQLLCRRLPPQVTMVMVPTKLQGGLQPIAMGAYPAVEGGQWCGEFVLKVQNVQRPMRRPVMSNAAPDLAALRVKYPMAHEQVEPGVLKISAVGWPNARHLELAKAGLAVDRAVAEVYERIILEIAESGAA